MTPETAIQIMTEEKLYIRSYNWFEDRKTKSGELGIIRKGDKWQIYVTDEERGEIRNIKPYLSLSEALDEFIDRMRAGKYLIERRWEEWDKESRQESEEFYLRSIELRMEKIKRKKDLWLVCKDRIYSLIS